MLIIISVHLRAYVQNKNDKRSIYTIKRGLFLSPEEAQRGTRGELLREKKQTRTPEVAARPSFFFAPCLLGSHDRNVHLYALN
ncbi:hypothetical protein ANTRET_LOCUS8158 [Anthophora retusa]